MCECKDASISDASETGGVIVVYAYVDTLVFRVSVSKSVISINGLSFVSARPAPQPCGQFLWCRGLENEIFWWEIYSMSI